MKRLMIFFLLLCLTLCGARAETILWEDENGQVILTDEGNVDIVPRT